MNASRLLVVIALLVVLVVLFSQLKIFSSYWPLSYSESPKFKCPNAIPCPTYNSSELSLIDFYSEYENHVTLVNPGAREGSLFGTNRAEISFIMSRGPNVQTVCETGFYLGMSSFLWLSNPFVKKVYSFDLDVDSNSLKVSALNLLKQRFGDRIEAIAGDSYVTVPEFVQKNLGKVKCDIVLVDGGHDALRSYTDLVYFKKISHANTHVMVDDYGDCGYCMEVKAGYDRAISERVVIPIVCQNTCFSSRPAELAFDNCVKDHYYCLARYSQSPAT